MRTVVSATLLLLVALLPAACRKPQYDTSTPERTVDAMQQMVREGHPERLLDLFHLEARDITYADGVTEASAIEDVRAKAKRMVAQLWRVSTKLRQRYPKEVAAEMAGAARGGASRSNSPSAQESAFARFMADPFGWLDANRNRLVVEDLGDGTAVFEIDGQPLLGGMVSMVETPQGWKLTVPATLVQGTPYFPNTREEWAVVAYMMLSLENAMTDFERELDAGKYRTLAAASQRVGRLLAEGAVAQAVIYYWMKQEKPAEKG